jgi:hypothetical protein
MEEEKTMGKRDKERTPRNFKAEALTLFEKHEKPV